MNIDLLSICRLNIDLLSIYRVNIDLLSIYRINIVWPLKYKILVFFILIKIEISFFFLWKEKVFFSKFCKNIYCIYIYLTNILNAISKFREPPECGNAMKHEINFLTSRNFDFWRHFCFFKKIKIKKNHIHIY